MKATYSRPIRRTTSGFALERPTTVSGITITAVTSDTLVNLRNLSAAGDILWSGEADNGASSFSRTFDPPIKFDHKLYIEFVSSGAQSSCTVEVIEP